MASKMKLVITNTILCCKKKRTTFFFGTKRHTIRHKANTKSRTNSVATTLHLSDIKYSKIKNQTTLQQYSSVR